MIRSNLNNPVEQSVRGTSLGGPLGALPIQKPKSKKISELTMVHFSNILDYIRLKKEEGRKSLTSVVPPLEGGFQSGGGRWGDIFL